MKRLLNHQLKDYIQLIRLHKPIPLFLLLWPTLWALWLAANGEPQLTIVSIFIAGVIIMRSAGCIINDVADRNFDAHVKRTSQRPLATGRISLRSALILFFVLCLAGFSLVLLLNKLTILLSIVGVVITIFYPFMKRFTHLPQVGLGFAFAWGVPMAFAAETSSVSWQAWTLFSVAALWPVIYDTQYAMVDRDDDVKIGIKSTAILFNQYDKKLIGLLQIIFLTIFAAIGWLFQLHWPFYLSIVLAGLFFLYQQYLIKNRDRENCLKAFLNNHWVGLIIFLGIILSYAL